MSGLGAAMLTPIGAQHTDFFVPLSKYKSESKPSTARSADTEHTGTRRIRENV
jgi:hypothetical protein